MELEVLRYLNRPKGGFSHGLWHDITYDREFLCHTLEDPHGEKKIPGETRIPEGRYRLDLRHVGPLHEKYLKRFGPEFHKGMLWIRDIPDFTYCYFHIANWASQLYGCVATGMSVNCESGLLGDSEAAYRYIYPKISSEILERKDVFVKFIDHDGDCF